MNIYFKTAGKIIKNKYIITIIVIILLYQLTDTEGFRGKMHMLGSGRRSHPTTGMRRPHARHGQAPPIKNIIAHKHASAAHNTHRKRMSGARVPVSFIPINTSRHRFTAPRIAYPHRRPVNNRWWDYLSFTWVPKLLGVCKRGCTYLGKGQHGCTHPGNTVSDCQFASDCRWC